MLDNGASNRNTFNADIPVNGSVSQSIDLLSSVLLGFVTPAVWTTAAIDIEVSLDNVTWFTSIYDSSSTATGVYLTPTVSSGYAIDTLAFLPYRYVRFRSGTTATPVVQAAARSIAVITRPFM
jgi:hypothetical protein